MGTTSDNKEDNALKEIIDSSKNVKNEITNDEKFDLEEEEETAIELKKQLQIETNLANEENDAENAKDEENAADDDAEVVLYPDSEKPISPALQLHHMSSPQYKLLPWSQRMLKQLQNPIKKCEELY